MYDKIIAGVFYMTNKQIKILRIIKRNSKFKIVLKKSGYDSESYINFQVENFENPAKYFIIHNIEDMDAATITLTEYSIDILQKYFRSVLKYVITTSITLMGVILTAIQLILK